MAILSSFSTITGLQISQLSQELFICWKEAKADDLLVNVLAIDVIRIWLFHTEREKLFLQ